MFTNIVMKRLERSLRRNCKNKSLSNSKRDMKMERFNKLLKKKNLRRWIRFNLILMKSNSLGT